MAQEPALAPPPVVKGIRVLEISGPISAALVPRMRAALEPVDPERFPAGAIALIESPGGDGLAGMELGRLFRAHRVHVFVRTRCASACVFLLAGGVVRGVAQDHAVGIHSARLTAFVKGLGRVDINSATNPRAAAALEAGNKRSENYFREMGLPDALYAAIAATPTEHTRYLDAAELPALGLAGIDRAYLEEREAAASARYKITAEEYAARTLLVASKCLDAKGLEAKVPPRDFVRCYSRVLQTGG